MCEEIKEELDRGKKAAEVLVEHFENMGNPTKCWILVETDKGCYHVTVKRKVEWKCEDCK